MSHNIKVASVGVKYHQYVFNLGPSPPLHPQRPDLEHAGKTQDITTC